MHSRYLAGVVLLGLMGCARTAKETAQTPATPAATGSTLESGTRVSVVLTDSISSVTKQAGDIVPAMINKDVRDKDKKVVIPSGSEAQLRITAFQPPMPNQTDARALLQLTAVKAAGHTIRFASETGGLGITASVRADPVAGFGQADTTAGPASPRDMVVKLGTKVDFKLSQPVSVSPQ